MTLTGLTASKTYEVRVRATKDEGDGPWASASTVTDGNVVTRSVAENSPAGTNVGAPVTATSNTNGYDLNHTLSGTDASSFSIASDTGQITVGTGATLDYDTKSSYSVIVTVTAAVAGIASIDPNAPGDYAIPVTISLTDVNEKPTFDDGATTSRSIAENSSAGTNVGAAVSATDQEGDTLTYSMSGTDAGKLTLDTATGQITVKSGSVPNYESKTSYSVTLSVTDNKKADGTADSTMTTPSR